MSRFETVDTWLKALEKALTPLPEPDRADILQEARAHIEERLETGQTIPAILNGFGTPQAYAQSFIDDLQLHQALHTNRVWPLTKALFNHARHGLAAILGLTGAAFFIVAIVIAALTTASKIVAPESVGYWRDATHSCIGACTKHPPTPEILGNWFYVIIGAVMLVAGFLAHQCLRLAGLAIVRNRKRR